MSNGYYSKEEAADLFRTGTQAYYQQPADLEGAKQAYLKLLNHGFGGPDLSYNLGTVYLAQGDIGPAVLHLERALKWQRAEDIEANLASAREKQSDQLVGSSVGEPFFKRLADVTDDQWVPAVALGTWWAILAIIFARRFLLKSRMQAATTAALVLLVVVALTSSLFTGLDAWVSTHYVEAVVLNQTVQVRDLPERNARIAFEIHGGLKVRITADSSQFVRIRLANNLEGWVERSVLAKL